jgi:hypothetical protein
MNTTLRILVAFLLAWGLHVQSKAEMESDFGAYKISLLTCHPGEAGYELYGHTAIRVCHPQTGMDWTYNYGIFDFDSPNFLGRFILGETNYMLGVAPFNRFIYQYAMQGRRVDEQVLNLTSAEKARLIAALEKNAQPEHRVYRYDFFSNNCVTMAIDKIVDCLDGQVIWPAAIPDQTFRSMLNNHTAQSPWHQFGQSLLLGAEADTIVGLREQCFSPIYTQRFFQNARIKNSVGEQRPLVASESILLHAKSSASALLVTPKVAFALLLVLSVALSWLYTRGWRRTFACFDVVVLLLTGFCGCLLAVLCFASEHPAVSHNYTLLLLHPLALVLVPWQWWLKRKGKPNFTAYVQVALVVAYLVGVGLFKIQEPTVELCLIAATIVVVNLAKIIHK